MDPKEYPTPTDPPFSYNSDHLSNNPQITADESKISLIGSKISLNGSKITPNGHQTTIDDPNISPNNAQITSTESHITFNELFKLLVYTKYTSLSRLKLVENVDEKKEFLILQGSNRTINNLKSTLTSSRLLERSTLTSSTLTGSRLVSKEFTNLLEQLKRYDNYFKKTSEQCKCKLPSESTSISIDYNLFRRTIPQNDTENPKFDPIEYSALEKSLNLLKSRYEYDFSKLVSYQNIIYQIFLFDSHEFHLMAKYSPDIDPATQLRLNNTLPTLYYVYNEISKHRSEFLEKISFKRLSVSNSLDKQKFGSESQKLGSETRKLQLEQQRLGLDQQRLGSVGNTFDALVTRLYETLMEHDIVLYIRIFKLNIVSVIDVESVILPVLRGILDELQSLECDYHWISLFTESYTVTEDPKLDYIYKVLYLILDFSFNNKLLTLVDVTIDVIFSFSIRNPNFSNILQCFNKYFKTIIYPILNTTGGKVVGGKVVGGISAELASGIPSSGKVSTSDLSTTLSTSPMTNGILIPCLYNLESIVLFEYLSLQYPILSHKTDNSIIKEMSTLIPKIGNFIIRIDIEILDQITLDKLYKKDTFNFKLYIKNKRNFFLIFSHGNIFFSTQSNSNINPINNQDKDRDPDKLVQDRVQEDKLNNSIQYNSIQDRIKIFNKGSKYLCIEILFNEYINIFINGKEFNNMKFEDDIEFYQVDFYYNIDNVNVKQFSTLTTGFRKFLIQSNVIEYPVTVLGPTASNGPEVSTFTDGTSNTNSTEDSSKDIGSKDSSKDIGTVGASTVTEGKGTNSMGMKCTSEKNSNEIAVVTKTGESGTFVDTEGGEDIKGAVGASTVTEGKGANSTLMECTMGNKADGINSIVDYIVYFSKGLSSIHMVISNINFNISLDNSFNPLNPKVFESLNILFELLLNIFESISTINFTILSTIDTSTTDSTHSIDSTDGNSIVMINLITIWRKLSESIISILSIIKIFFSLPINIEQIPLGFLNNLTKILYESIKYKSYYMVPETVPETKDSETVPETVPKTKVPKTKDSDSKHSFDSKNTIYSKYPDPKHYPDSKYPHSKYPESTYLHFQNLHHPIDLISLANTVNLISLDILGSNQLISTQLFSYTSTQLLSEILMNIAYTSYFITDLTIFTKNNTLNFLNQSLCIEIFTKRTLTDVFIQNIGLGTGPSKVTRPTGPGKATRSTDPNKATKLNDPNKSTKLTTNNNKATKSTTNPTTPTTPTDPSITTKLITNPVEINLWWKLIYELLESDKLLLKNDILNDNCKCNLKLNELMLLDPMFNYCNYCLRKYFNYFSSIESLNYYTKLLSNENFYTIPRPSMLLCRFLLKHGITILLFNLYNKSNKSFTKSFTKSCNKSENGLESDSESVESKSDSQSSMVDSTGDLTVELTVDKLFEEYLIIFIPNNLKLIEEIFIYLLKLNEQILYIFGDLLKFDFRLLNFLNCLSILDLLTYFYEFIQSGTKYFLHIISCIKLLPYLIKVLLLYNKIFRILKYQKFNPINYLIYQFSSLLIIYMKFIQYIYTNDFKLGDHNYRQVDRNYRQVVDNLTQVDQYISKQVEDELKDVNYIFKFPKCLVTNLNFNFNSSNGAWSNGTSSSNGTVDSSNIDSSKSMDSSNMDNCDNLDNTMNLDNSKTLNSCDSLDSSNTLDTDMEIIGSIRKLLLLVQDFKYIKGTSISFRNISEIESFITNSHESEYKISNLTRGLLNMENWATKIFSDSFDQVHPRLIKLRYTLIALFIHLGSDCEITERLVSDNEVSGHLGSDNNRLEYHEAKKYSRIVCMKIFNKFQTMRCQNIKDKDLMKEMYLEDVISRCVWLIKNTPSHSNNGKLYGKNTMYVDTVSKMKTSTYHMMDYRTKLRSGTIFRRSNSSTNLNTNSYSSLKIDNTTKFDSRGVRDSRVVKSSRDSRNYRTYSTDSTDYNSSTVFRNYITRDNRIFDDNFNELVEFILNGPTRLECEKRFLTHRLTSLIRISLLSSLKALIYSFLDLGYVHTHILKYNFSPLVVDLLVNPNLNTLNNPNTVGNNHNTFGNTNPNTVNNPNTGTNLTAVNSLNDILDLFWYIMINKLRPIMLSTYKDSNFELINGNKHVPDIYNRVVYDYLCSILENICDWYIRSGITTIDSTNYNRPNMNFWLGISLSFFSLVYSLGLEPMTDTRYSFQIFNYMMSILHPLPLSNFKKAMSNQTSLSCYTVEVALVIYFSEYFLVNFGETVENLFHCLKMRKFTRKDQLIVPGGTIYLMVKKSSKISETLKQDEPINLSFTHLWSFPKIENTSHGLGHLIYNFYVNFDQSNTTVMDSVNMDTNTLNPIRNVSLEENDIIMWRMENYCYLISEVSLTKRTSNNIAMVINTSREITVYLTLPKNITNRITNEIELSLVNYLGGNLEIEGVNGTWTQVLGIKGLDYFYVVRSNLYLLLKYLLWVELSTNLHTANNNKDTNSTKDSNSTNRVDVGKLCRNNVGKLCINRIDVGLVLGILFKYLRSTAIQIFNLSSVCNCKDNPEKVSIKYHCSNISCQFKYSTTIKGYLVDSDNTADNLLVTRGCSTCSTNQIYKKELDFFWGNILSYLISLVRVCENYSLVYMVLNSLLTTFTLGERQAQAFLSMDSLGQKFCNLLVVTIKQLSATSNNIMGSVNKGVNTSVNSGVKGCVNKFGVCDYGYMKTVLASPKIHALFVLKWLPPLKQVPLECIYATLRENFQSILISKSFKPVTKIEPNDPFVTLPHSDHFVTHRNSVDFEADISENTLQVIRANNMGGIVMYRIPTTLGTTAVQLTTNFYILNASRFGITVAPADCVFGTVSDLFERNDVVGFSHSNSLGFTSQLFAATIGYTIGDVLTAHFTLDHQEDGQLCLRTELLIGGNSIGSVLEVVFDPITQNDPSRRMSLVFIFQDPATLVLRGTSINPDRNTGTNPGTLSESNIMSTFLTTNVRREIPTTNDRITSYNMNDRSNSYPNIRQINGELDRELDRELVNRDQDNRDQFNVGEVNREVVGGNEIIGSSNVEVVRALDRIVSRETSATARSRTVTEQSIPISDRTNSIEPFPVDTQSSSPRDMNETTLNETTLNENVLTFNYKKYFNVEDSEVSFDNVPEWDVKFDSVESDVVEESPITLCKDEFWDKLLRDDKYTCLFAQFSDSVQVYQSVLSVNVPMFSGLKRELVMKIKSSFDDLYTLLSSNFKYTRLESTVRDCFSWLCVLCCDHDRQVWEKLSQKEFKVVSDFTLPFLLGSSFPSKTTLVTLPNELLLELFASISKILTIRLVITSLTLCATKKGSVRFIHGDVQTDSLIFVIASKSLLASTLILKVLSHRCFKHDLYSSTITNGISALNADFLHLLDGLTSFITQYLSSCEDFVISSNNIENVAFSNVESILQSLNINSTNISTQVLEY
ncbi:uncharacterized protein TA09560 [Theileria annulata]|uniref:Uncharacterized protein n=1 Tax=Theileria annulata TaxID=5874 RepID=Q4UJ23_THEAN|nr:uncharacterized protein TA09560 [Theileria annulata]CAI72916.1 hypothetical protein, conserved [Theileria annulata]|eukprot:XP_953594.1 hypothetical protein, conserved [Theileria annulata]